jgi:hypothetical protein
MTPRPLDDTILVREGRPMIHSPSAPDGGLPADQEAIYGTVGGRLREIDVAFDAIASEIFLRGDAGRLGRELRLRISRELTELAADVGGLAHYVAAGADGPREGDDG